MNYFLLQIFIVIFLPTIFSHQFLLVIDSKSPQFSRTLLSILTDFNTVMD